ncbi:tetratricopeptide repeat protein [Aeoliella sp. ICT_H6.2]|uniref:Tetratricopeptide repeat protein n=1 Tax=Aeoliella straminimaris TaxID=2954799 RepID=A0A9X2JF96_9BACT|nr:tetratricopeptide repeat protein [Aeoliella straminimaris]MCO6043077.1 tetratricopeptide repeat protein [Aeoliella straminimaris]
MSTINFLRFACCPALLAALLTTAAFAQDEFGAEDTPSQNPFEQANAALENEEWDKATDMYTQILNAATAQRDTLAEAAAYIGRGQAWAGLELYQQALDDFRKADDLTNSADPKKKALRAELQYQRGKMYLDMGSQFIGAALPDLQAAHNSNRTHLPYVFALGKAYALGSPYQAGFGEQAEPLLTEYLDENPNDAEALRLRGTAYASMNEVEDAFADLNRSVELDSNDYQTYSTMGTLHIAEQQYPEAIEAIKKAIEVYEPQKGQEDVPFAQGYITLAVVYEEIGKTADDKAEREAALTDSIKSGDELLDLLPESHDYDNVRSEVYYHQGLAHRFLEEYGQAVKALGESINLNPEKGEAYFRRAICFVNMGEYELALRDLTDTQSLNFEDARAYLWQGITYAKMGKYREAIRAYNTAISFSNRYADAYRNRAHAYFQLGEFDSAIDSFNECIRLDFENASNYYKRGLCYDNLGKPDEAAKSYINAIRFDEQFAAAYDRLIPLLEQQGQADLAEQYRAKRATLSTSAGA